jgi:hypothetical protein
MMGFGSMPYRAPNHRVESFLLRVSKAAISARRLRAHQTH